MSLGVATFPADASEPGELVCRADHALYRAKAGGRNRVELYGRTSRSFRRTRVELRGGLRNSTSESQSLKTVNLSQGGMLLQTPASLGEGSLVDISLTIPDQADPVRVAGRVVQTQRCPRGEVEAAVRFMEITPDDRARLNEYLSVVEADVEPVC